MCVDDRCTIVTSTPFSHERLADVVRRVVGPDHHRALADVAVGAGVGAGVMLIAAEDVLARQRRHARLARHARRQHQLGGMQCHPLAVAVEFDGPRLLLLVERRRQAARLRPVRDFHDAGVELEPVADLVLRREHRPVLRERHVRQVVVPDGVVQAQGLVALAPLIAWPFVLVDDDRGHAELTQSGAERDAALAAADHQRVRLGRVPERGLFVVAFLGPRTRVGIGAVHGAHHPGRALALLVSLELLQRGEQCPAFVALEAEMADAAARGRLELDERGGDVTVGGRLLAGVEARGLRLGEAGVQHVGDAVAALHGLDVPGEGDEVAPEAVDGELRRSPLDVADGKGGLEVREPCVDAGLGRERGSLFGGVCLFDRVGHVTQRTPCRPPGARVASRCTGPPPPCRIGATSPWRRRLPPLGAAGRACGLVRNREKRRTNPHSRTIGRGIGAGDSATGARPCNAMQLFRVWPRSHRHGP